MKEMFHFIAFSGIDTAAAQDEDGEDERGEEKEDKRNKFLAFLCVRVFSFRSFIFVFGASVAISILHGNA